MKYLTAIAVLTAACSNPSVGGELDVSLGGDAPADTRWTGELDDPQFEEGVATFDDEERFATLDCEGLASLGMGWGPDIIALGGTNVTLAIWVEDGEPASVTATLTQWADFNAYGRNGFSRQVRVTGGSVQFAEFEDPCPMGDGFASGTFELRTEVGELSGMFATEAVPMDQPGPQ